MNFRSTSKRRGEVESRIDVTNLVDIAFLLIIFFTLSTSFAPSVKGSPGIKVDLPKSSSKEIETEKKSSVLVMTKEGVMMLDGKTITQQDLESGLRAVSESAKEVVLIVQADKSVPHGKVVTVMDLAKSLGINRLAIATEEK